MKINRYIKYPLIWLVGYLIIDAVSIVAIYFEVVDVYNPPIWFVAITTVVLVAWTIKVILMFRKAKKKK